VKHPSRAKRTNRRPKRTATAPRAGAGANPVGREPAGEAAVAAGEAAVAKRACALPALPAALDIRGIGETFEFLRSAVNCGIDSIDASRVVSVDTAGLQLLLAAGRTAAAHGRALRWAGASSSLVEAATRLGVAGILGIARPG